MKRKLILTALITAVALEASGCGKDLPDESGNNNVSAPAQSKESSADENWPEATWAVAAVIKIEASVYFTEEVSHQKIIHDIVSEDDGFGNHLIKTHPTLKDMEFILEFDDRDAPFNVFCIQTHTDPVSMGCSGEHKKLSDWEFETWDDVLKHYDLSGL